MSNQTVPPERQYATTSLVTAAFLRLEGFDPLLQEDELDVASVCFVFDSVAIRPALLRFNRGDGLVEPRGFHETIIDLRKAIDRFLG